jgi:hypothetical protein
LKIPSTNTQIPGALQASNWKASIAEPLEPGI